MSAPIDRGKLGRVLGLLGSDHDGEVLAAARQAERIRRGTGLTWAQILSPPLPAPQPPLSLSGAIRELLSNADTLTDWELDFITSIKSADYDLSPKQAALIEKLLRKVRRSQGRAA